MKWSKNAQVAANDPFAGLYVLVFYLLCFHFHIFQGDIFRIFPARFPALPHNAVNHFYPHGVHPGSNLDWGLHGLVLFEGVVKGVSHWLTDLHHGGRHPGSPENKDYHNNPKNLDT